ncbi:MAG: radical SAM/SPASM domain-containing protein [Aggregatilineales bacterium]
MRLKRLLNLAGDRLYALPLVVLYLTDGCNSRCIACDIWRSPRRNMAFSLAETAAMAFPAVGTRHVLLSGGEAMQHPEWPRIARLFRAAGARVMLLTNGLLLRRQLDEVLASVDEVIVSLDAGTASTYAAIRGVDGFDLVLDGIRAVRNGGLPVITRTTVQRANYRELPQIIEAALAADVNRISFLAVDVSSQHAFGPRFLADPALSLSAASRPCAPPERGPAAAALQADDLPELARVLETVERRFASAFSEGRIAETPAKLRRMVSYFSALLGEGEAVPPRCNAPHLSVVIEVDGTLRPCYFLPAFGQLVPGGQLARALNVPEAVALRRAYRAGQRPECARCVCPLYRGPRALLTM